MLSKEPTDKTKKELIKLQGLLSEAYKDLLELTNEEKSFINKCALISNVGASTRIENAILTDSEIEWVDSVLREDGRTTAAEENKDFIINKLSKDKERSIEEVIGCRELLTIIYNEHDSLYPLTESNLRGLHNELLKHYPKASHYKGKYKTSLNKVISKNLRTGKETIVLAPAPPGILTKTAMADLMDWYNKTIKEYPYPILVASEFTFRFLAIHPFQDGNGRLGRGLFILSLLQSKDKYLEAVIPYLAIDRHIEQNKSQYYSVLNRTSGGKFEQDHKKYKLESLNNFFIKIIESSIGDIKIYKDKYTNQKNLSEASLTVLNCFKNNPKERLKVSNIEKQVKIPRRTIQYSLNTLVKENFIQKLGKGAGVRYQLMF